MNLAAGTIKLSSESQDAVEVLCVPIRDAFRVISESPAMASQRGGFHKFLTIMTEEEVT